MPSTSTQSERDDLLKQARKLKEQHAKEWEKDRIEKGIKKGRVIQRSKKLFDINALRDPKDPNPKNIVSDATSCSAMVDAEFQRKWECGNLENLTAINSLLQQWGTDAKSYWRSH
eukprot:10950834-Karenia_brevis.AAC.1